MYSITILNNIFRLTAHPNFGGDFMDKSKTNENDKLLTRQSTTGSYGTSKSANLTSASSGTVDDDSDSFFPNFHKEESWYRKTTATMDLDIDDTSK